MHCEVISTVSQLCQLEGEWRRLWHQCAWATPFQRPEWLLSYCAAFGIERVLAIAVRDQGTLVALAPFVIYEDTDHARRLVPLGAGYSDYLDGLVAAAHLNATVPVILQQIGRAVGQWDVACLEQLSPEGLFYKLAASVVGVDAFQRDVPCPALPLDGRLPFSKSIPAEQWKKLAYYRRRSEREGSIRYVGADSENFEELFSVLVLLHGARWQTRNEAGMFDDERIERLHRTAARRFLDAGVLSLFGLRLDGRWIAAYYGFRCARRDYYYLSGFEPEARSLSPGMLIVGHAIEQALLAGSETFDFLRGAESYKYDWGAVDQATWQAVWRASQVEPVPQAALGSD